MKEIAGTIGIYLLAGLVFTFIYYMVMDIIDDFREGSDELASRIDESLGFFILAIVLWPLVVIKTVVKTLFAFLGLFKHTGKGLVTAKEFFTVLWRS